MIATIEIDSSFFKKIIKGLLRIIIIITISYYSFINFNFSIDTIEAIKFEETRKKDRSLYVKAERVVSEFYYGQPENALIMAKEIVNEYPGNIYAKKLVRELNDYFMRQKVIKNDMILIKNQWKHFWIDTQEVTVVRYKRFIKTAFGKKYFYYKPEPSDLYSNPEYADKPVNLRAFTEGYDFCYWAGKRLPKPAEWETAMRYLHDRISEEKGKSMDIRFKYLLDKFQVYGLYQMTDKGMYIEFKQEQSLTDYKIGIRCVSD